MTLRPKVRSVGSACYFDIDFAEDESGNETESDDSAEDESENETENVEGDDSSDDKELQATLGMCSNK